MRSQRTFLALPTALAFTLAACGGSGVTVQVLADSPDGGAQPVRDLPVRFLPFDRDSLFDVLAARAEEPEPQMPADLLATFDRISALQADWREKETEWAETREQLQRLSDRLSNMDRRSREYRRLFQQFNRLDASEKRLNREKQAAFEAFDSLQQTALTRADSVRAVIESWEDVAFADYGELEDSILEAVGHEVFEDTTNADGYVTRKLPGGDWWVHARVSTADGERYWNVHIDPERTDTLALTAANGEDRLKL
ncbi:MAG: hypothetical protein ACE5HF_06930 [Gemmatimonadota bacterium]